jgi:hypothetical protein
MKRESKTSSVIPPTVADRLDGLGSITFERLKTPSIDDLIESQIENIEGWDFDDSNGVLDPAALWDIHCNLAIITILAEHRASQPDTSFPMRTTVNISEELAGNAKTVARLLGYSEENIGKVVESYADWEIEAMANDPDHLIRELGDLVWEDREESQGVAQRVIEHAGLDAGTLQVVECQRGWTIAPVRG